MKPKLVYTDFDENIHVTDANAPEMIALLKRLIHVQNIRGLEPYLRAMAELTRDTRALLGVEEERNG